MQNCETRSPLPAAGNRAPGAADNSKAAWFGLAAVVIYSAIRNLFRAASKPFWVDEIFTWGVAHQPNLAAIWNALYHAVDSSPFGYYVIEKEFSRFIPNQEIALRLPSVLAFCCLLICTFAFVRRRSGSFVALVCAAMPLITVLYDTYATEARPYLLVTAFVSLAMVCYQRAPATGWMVLMGASFAAAQAVHYYTIFVLVPFGIAEAVVLVRNRRIRWPVWLAFVAGTVPFILFWPLLSASNKYYGSNFWARPSFLGAESVYGWFLNIPYGLGVGIAGACVAGIITALFCGSEEGAVPDGCEKTPFEEYILLLGLIGLPFIVFIATRIAGSGAIVQRYMLPSALAIQISASYLLRGFGRRAIGLFAIFLALTVATNDAQFWLTELHQRGKMVSQATVLEKMLDSTPYSDLPIVISDGTEYLPIFRYASPKYGNRYLSIVDVPAALSYTGSDSVDKALLLWRSYLPIQVQQYSSFASAHPTFLLYSTTGGQFDWWPTRLLHDGNTLTVVAMEQNRRLFLVNLRSRDQRQAP